MNKDFIRDGFGDLFTTKEWNLWVKGEFNLFDNYVERVGMTKEDADRMRDKYASETSKKNLTSKKNDARIINKQ